MDLVWYWYLSTPVGIGVRSLQSSSFRFLPYAARGNTRMHHETAWKNERPIIGTVVRASMELLRRQRQRRNGWQRVVSPKCKNTEAVMSRAASGIRWMKMIVICIIGCTIVDGFISDTTGIPRNHPPRLFWWLPAVSRSDLLNDDATIGTSTCHDGQYTLMTWNLLAPGTSVIYDGWLDLRFVYRM